MAAAQRRDGSQRGAGEFKGTLPLHLHFIGNVWKSWGGSTDSWNTAALLASGLVSSLLVEEGWASPQALLCA